MKLVTWVLGAFLALSVPSTAAATTGNGGCKTASKACQKPKAPLPSAPKAKAQTGATPKLDEASLGSAARREMLKNRLQATKPAAKKPMAKKTTNPRPS